jgi:hypothetical protein
MRTSVLWLALSPVLAMTVAACSAGSPSPSVAHLGTPSTTSVPSSGGGSGGQATATAGGPAQLAKMESYAQCMRTHGIADFPDPTSGPDGGAGFQLRGGPGSDIDPNSPKFQAADKACRPLLPNGGVHPQLTAAQQQQFLSWAACVRAHGVPSFPDPTFTGGGVQIRIADKPGSGPGPVQLQAAQQACKSKLPGGFGGLGG